MSSVRLQKYLAECGIASRRRAEVLIARGQVAVNGVVVTEPGCKITPGVDRVDVKGRRAREQEKGVILLNKPRHVVCTKDDPQGRPTVMEYLTSRYQSYFPVGRLDFDSEGLVILTNDGELADALLHPRYGVERRYEVEVRGSVSGRDCTRIERGIRLDDGIVAAKVQVHGTYDGVTSLELVLTSGRNRVIRRMMEKLGFRVETLRRTAHGPFRLGNMAPGAIQRLSERQYRTVRDKLERLRDRGAL